jgi:heme/copper-type cytochrome/quinol oxidase subunit 2
MDTTTIILINVGVLIFGIIFYIIWNLMRKNEKLEDELLKRDNYIENITTIMSESDRKIKEIQELINEYNINK